ncbi:MAG: hypothetical protein HC903_27450 [Methylacidiphilales bacterium]|nr:hypothetical protein [Candidatus Methylacidiphilales bacterium]
MTNYDFSSVGEENLQNLATIFTNIKELTQVQDSYQKLKVFEESNVL